MGVVSCAGVAGLCEMSIKVGLSSIFRNLHTLRIERIEPHTFPPNNCLWTFCTVTPVALVVGPTSVCTSSKPSSIDLIATGTINIVTRG